jgi:hypothetical protein
MSSDPKHVFDPTRATSARIYDALLDGSAHLPIDRETADKIAQVTPLVRKAAKLNRWFLGYAAKFLGKNAQLPAYIDFGTGLSTAGSLYEYVSPPSKVLCVDYDPEVINYAEMVLGHRSDVKYVVARIEDIESILDTATTFFGAERRVGLFLITMAHFINDTTLRHAFRELFAWAAPGSWMVVSSADRAILSAGANANIQSQYQQATGLLLHPRPAQYLQSLAEAAGWLPYQGGLRPFEEYVDQDVERSIVLDDHEREGIGYGGFLTHP